MAGVRAGLERASERHLVDRGDRGREEPELAVEICVERGRKHQVGDAQRRGEALRERREVHDRSGRVHARERRNGPSREAKLAVEVVLHDEAGGVLGRPAKKLVATRHAHDAARGKLVRRHDVRHPRPGRAKRLRGEAVRVHGQVARAQARGGIRPGDRRISWVLHGNSLVFAQVEREHCVKRLCARRHDHAAGIHGHATCTLEVGRDGLTQPEKPTRGRDLVQDGIRLVGKRVAQAALPEPGRAGGCMGRAVREVVARRSRGALGRDGRLFSPRRRHGRRDCGAGGQTWQARDEEAAAWPRLDVALRHKLAIRALHGDDAHAQALGQRTPGREAVPCGDGTACDVVADAAVQVLVKGQVAAGGKVVAPHGNLPSGIHLALLALHVWTYSGLINLVRFGRFHNIRRVLTYRSCKRRQTQKEEA